MAAKGGDGAADTTTASCLLLLLACLPSQATTLTYLCGPDPGKDTEPWHDGQWDGFVRDLSGLGRQGGSQWARAGRVPNYVVQREPYGEWVACAARPCGSLGQIDERGGYYSAGRAKKE